MAGNKYNIYAVLSEKGKEKVAEVSSVMEKAGLKSFFARGKEPHITLYLTEFKDHSLFHLMEKMKRVAQLHDPFEVRFEDQLSKTKGNWLFLDLEENRKLQHLSDHVVFEMNTLRDESASLPPWLGHYPSKLAAFKRYGSPNVFQNFEPHVTLLADYQDEGELDLFLESKGLKEIDFSESFKVEGIAIGEVDEFGQIEGEPIAYYPFGAI